MIERCITSLLICAALIACVPYERIASLELTRSQVPARLAVPTGNAEFLRATGRGVQIYTCGRTDGGPSWTLSAPDAVLANEAGFVSSHGAGPSWTAADGSSVVGRALAESPSPDEGAVPWLLVRAELSGEGTLAATTFIQRLDTVGGVAPAGGCSAATLGAQARSPYSATYVFFEASRS